VQARKVEHSLDIKLASYSKIASEDASTKVVQLYFVNRVLLRQEMSLHPYNVSYHS
jgi:hypothetical protein